MIIGISQPSSVLLSKSRFQRSYNWDVLLPDISLPIGGLEGFALAQYVQDVSFGDYSISEISKIRVGPYEANYAGLFTVDKVKITFLKPVPDFICNYFYAWKNLIIDSKTGIYNVKSKYRKTIYIRFLDTTGVSIERWKLTGCFPTSFPKFDNLSYKTEDIVTIPIELSVDKIERE